MFLCTYDFQDPLCSEGLEIRDGLHVLHSSMLSPKPGPCNRHEARHEAKAQLTNVEAWKLENSERQTANETEASQPRAQNRAEETHRKALLQAVAQAESA